MDLTNLKTWSDSNALGTRTIQRFWAFFQAYKEEHGDVLKQAYDDFDDSLLIAKLDRIGLQINDWSNDEKTSIVAYISLQYKKCTIKRVEKKYIIRMEKNTYRSLGIIDYILILKGILKGKISNYIKE